MRGRGQLRRHTTGREATASRRQGQTTHKSCGPRAPGSHRPVRSCSEGRGSARKGGCGVPGAGHVWVPSLGCRAAAHRRTLGELNTQRTHFSLHTQPSVKVRKVKLKSLPVAPLGVNVQPGVRTAAREPRRADSQGSAAACAPREDAGLPTRVCLPGSGQGPGPPHPGSRGNTLP